MCSKEEKKSQYQRQCNFSNFFPSGKNVEEKNNRLLTSCRNFCFRQIRSFILLFKHVVKEKSRNSTENPFRHRLTFDHWTAFHCSLGKGEIEFGVSSGYIIRAFFFLVFVFFGLVLHSFLWKINPLVVFVFLVCVWDYLAQNKFKPNQEFQCVLNLRSLYLEHKEHGPSVQLALPAFHQWCMQKSITEECVTSFDMDPCPETW